RELNHPPGIHQHLHRLRSRDLVEKPPATGVHEERMTLHLEELDGPDSLMRRESPAGVPREIKVESVQTPIQQDVDIFVARGPRVFQQGRCFPLVELARSIAEAIESVPQGPAPVLLPALAPGVAAAIRPPSLDSVHAAPRRVFNDLYLPLRRVLLEK